MVYTYLEDEMIAQIETEKDSNEGFLNLIKAKEDDIRTFLPAAPRSPTNEQEMLMAYKIDECNGDRRQVKRCLALLHAHHWNPEERATVYFDILNAFSKQVKEPMKHTPSKIVVYGLTVQGKMHKSV